MERALLIQATVCALRSIGNPRLFQTERGYQGAFLCALQSLLHDLGIVDGQCILEMEYQKRQVRHITQQRPDIILHVPTEISGDAVTSNNFAVWALKRKAKLKAAKADFVKLDDMFSSLHYPLGFFINIDSEAHYLEEYRGDFRERLVACAVSLNGDTARVRASCWHDERVVDLSM